MIIDEKATFREGLKTLLEVKFGTNFKIIEIGPDTLSKYVHIKPPKLIIIDQLNNPKTEKYLLEMRNHGTKVILLSSDPEYVQDTINILIFDGLLLKNMQTRKLLTVLEEIINYDGLYVHPEIASQLLLKMIQNENKKEKIAKNA